MNTLRNVKLNELRKEPYYLEWKELKDLGKSFKKYCNLIFCKSYLAFFENKTIFCVFILNDCKNRNLFNRNLIYSFFFMFVTYFPVYVSQHKCLYTILNAFTNIKQNLATFLTSYYRINFVNSNIRLVVTF